ncbi:hypothetical protein NLY39_03455 [Pseudomonas sp. KHPS1]|nr:hypothetical protein [Pseudomonas sp. KHPS1]UTH37230.1 hypothetical protein NLY39_03455 [Pseudomonas sp. KHPS1]
MMRRYFSLLLAVLCFLSFLVAAHWRAQQPVKFPPDLDRVVLSAPVLLSLYGGDRYLAADLEAIRLASTGMDYGQVNSHYLIRAQAVVAELNPCHEDNYYLANGLLTWGGAVSEGNEVLRSAMNCRFWDGVPGFFYGVNKSFFEHDTDEAVLALNISADRWPENAAALRKLAVMLRFEQFSDERLALGYLTQQRDTASDSKLKGMLDKRVIRLQGLVDLRSAQRRYESQHGLLSDLTQLVSSGELPVIPEDPLRLGYELKNGQIILKKLQIVGMEEQP